MTASTRGQVLFATRNPGKVRELRQMLAAYGIEVTSLLDFPELPEIGEDGATMAENAAKKAREISTHTGLLVVADDSGLEVDALDGAPGIHSNRFMGCETTEAERNTEILRRLEGVPEERRTCRFRCAVAIARDGRVLATTEATCEGRIARHPRGAHGFGYDPLFYLPDRDCTMAELTPEQKNTLSHRGKALRQAAEAILDWVRAGD